MVLDGYEKFLDKIFEGINKLDVDVTGLELDYLAYMATSLQNYKDLFSEVEQLGTLVGENDVHGNMVAIFKLALPLKCNNFVISAFELISPKDAEIVHFGLQHVEFVLNEDFQSFADKYPNIEWNLKAMNRPYFARIKFSLNDGLEVKFHKESILTEK